MFVSHIYTYPSCSGAILVVRIEVGMVVDAIGKTTEAIAVGVVVDAEGGVEGVAVGVVVVVVVVTTGNDETTVTVPVVVEEIMTIAMIAAVVGEVMITGSIVGADNHLTEAHPQGLADLPLLMVVLLQLQLTLHHP